MTASCLHFAPSASRTARIRLSVLADVSAAHAEAKAHAHVAQVLAEPSDELSGDGQNRL
jgi:hypothetical protein